MTTHAISVRLPTVAVFLTFAWCAAGRAADDDKPAKEEAREAIGSVVSPTGTLLARSSKETGWRVLKSKAEVFSTDPVLALPGCRGQVEPSTGGGQLILWGNLPEFSSVPLFESEVVFHKDPSIGLSFTLLRGRVVLTGQGKGKGAVQARVRVNDQVVYELRLADKDSEVAVEMYKRWPTGTTFTTNRRTRRTPHILFVVTALKGKAFVKAGDEQHLVTAPSTFQWDNFTGPDAKPVRAPKVPDWVEAAPATAEARQMAAAVERLQKRLQDSTVEKAIADQLASENTQDRHLAVYAYAATDDLSHLAEALSDVKRPEVRAGAVIGLRQWMGQAPDNDLQLYHFLVKEWQYTPEQSEIVLQLLNGFRDTDWDRAETYETLIEYLRHRKRSVRELAHSHLYRRVIAGRSIPYDAASSTEQLERAYRAWKQLIPDGKLPPAPSKEPK